MTIGIDEYDMSNIFQSVDFLMSGEVPYEFRTTVVRQFHKREDFAAIGRWIKGAKRYYLQSFVDSGVSDLSGNERVYERDDGAGVGDCAEKYSKCEIARGVGTPQFLFAGILRRLGLQTKN